MCNYYASFHLLLQSIRRKKLSRFTQIFISEAHTISLICCQSPVSPADLKLFRQMQGGCLIIVAHLSHLALTFIIFKRSHLTLLFPPFCFVILPPAPCAQKSHVFAIFYCRFVAVFVYAFFSSFAASF